MMASAIMLAHTTHSCNVCQMCNVLGQRGAAKAALPPLVACDWNQFLASTGQVLQGCSVKRLHFGKFDTVLEGPAALAHTQYAAQSCDQQSAVPEDAESQGLWKCGSTVRGRTRQRSATSGSGAPQWVLVLDLSPSRASYNEKRTRWKPQEVKGTRPRAVHTREIVTNG